MKERGRKLIDLFFYLIGIIGIFTMLFNVQRGTILIIIAGVLWFSLRIARKYSRKKK